MVPENDAKPTTPLTLSEAEFASLRSLAALAPALAALAQQKPPAQGPIIDDARTAQIVTEVKRQGAEELRRSEERSSIRLAEIFRLRKEDAARQALVGAGFSTACDVLTPHLVRDLDVVEDEKSADNPFRTVVRGPAGVERHTVGRDKSDQGHPMTAAERALEMAQDQKWKRYLDADQGKDKNKPRLPQNVSVPSQGYQAPQQAQQHQYQGSPSLQQPADYQMDPVEMLVLARGGTVN